MNRLRWFFHNNAGALTGLTAVLYFAFCAAVLLYAVYVLAGWTGLVLLALMAAVAAHVYRQQAKVNR